MRGRKRREAATPSALAPALARWARARGVDVLLDGDAEADEVPITSTELDAMMGRAASALGEPHLGLRLPSELAYRKWDAGSLAARVAATPGDVLRAIARFATLVFPRLEASVTDGRELTFHARLDGVSHHVAEYVVAFALAHCRRGGAVVVPSRVWLATARAGDLAPLYAAFGTDEIELGAETTGFSLPRPAADLALPAFDPMLVAVAEQLASAALSRSPRAAASIGDAVAAKIEATLDTGPPSLDALAGRAPHEPADPPAAPRGRGPPPLRAHRRRPGPGRAPAPRGSADPAHRRRVPARVLRPRHVQPRVPALDRHAARRVPAPQQRSLARRHRRRRMLVRALVFVAILSVVLGSAHRYVWARLVRDAALPAPWARLATIALVVLFVLLIGGFFAVRTMPRSVVVPMMWVAYTWTGILFFLVLALGLSDLARVLATHGAPTDPERRLAVSRLFGGVAAVLGIGVSGVGLVSALSPVAVKRVRVGIARLGATARIVQISDVHVGPTIGKRFIEDIVARINALTPDVVAITGDLVDGSVEALAEHVAPLAGLKAKHGVYFVTGNHEYYSGADEWIAHLETLGIKVLRNERVPIAGEQGFDLAGIDDHNASGNGHGSDLKRALAGRDPGRPCVLLAHQPRGIELADALGVDLQLSGHTHGGQMFPWNLMVRLQQPFVAGLHRLARAQIYVSKGTGYWGPPMRVGAPAEITEIELVPA